MLQKAPATHLRSFLFDEIINSARVGLVYDNNLMGTCKVCLNLTDCALKLRLRSLKTSSHKRLFTNLQESILHSRDREISQCCHQYQPGLAKTSNSSSSSTCSSCRNVNIGAVVRKQLTLADHGRQQLFATTGCEL